MKKTELAWAAGLIDGEGCISLVGHPAHQFKKAKTFRFHLVLKVTMCSQETILRLYDLFKTGSLSTRKPKRGEHVSASYTWVCNAAQVAKILSRLRPYLFTKAAEADVALEFLRLPPAPLGGPWGSPRVPKELQEKRLSCFKRLRALKTRSRFMKYGKKPGAKPKDKSRDKSRWWKWKR